MPLAPPVTTATLPLKSFMLALPSSSFAFAGGLACRIRYHLERPLAAATIVRLG
jgi:hypothetical protein